MQTLLTILVVLTGIIVIVTVLMQPSKSDALSGLIQGSNNDTFFSKNKARTKEVILARITMIAMIIFALSVLGLHLL
ncbi:preprotein translocase subunit SecG [Clostridium thermobutyricum]|uniref:Protein-export membrane protein SecG n=2 Tax=Clostridium thermobutyricum TaxID=29372 RepID=N9XS98_9CLOT|nr:preprotein translocase subunit SecG [Clostridium thermobutyricum]ENZ02573.1 preprotein translocase, SecG subunit [Clostridium thermobutyricum]OPX47753.1 preprotein translocase subunit SecG [Clostridium thermobutyricum DSM 4928]